MKTIFGLKQFKQAVEQSSDAIFITNRRGFIEYINPAFERMTGFNRAEILGKKPGIIKSGLHDRRFYLNLWKTIASGKTFRDTLINKKKNGALFYVDHTITPIKNSHGEIINFIGIWKDVTEYKKLEKVKDDFLNIAAHELKTPITSIKVYSQMMENGIARTRDEKLQSYYQKLKNHIDRLTNLVHELLDTTRITTGKLSLFKELFSIEDLVRKTVREVEEIYQVNNFRIIADKDIRIRADRNKLGQVILNFLTNALKYSPPNSEIVIRLSFDKSNVILSVKDKGIGIPPKYHQKIFERYFQVETAIKSKDLSMGLGLYISSSIIKAHKGKIWVESKEGKGSTLYFSLPFVEK